MALSESQLEERISGIKLALRELESTLEDGPVNETKANYVEPPMVSYKKFRQSEESDLKLLLEYEKQRNSTLESRILQKDELIREMSALQNELYSNIEELQHKANNLKSDLDYCQAKNKELYKELESFALLLKAKDSELQDIINENSQLQQFYIERTEESKLLSQELSIKEPDRKLMHALEKRNQELLLELNQINKSSLINDQLKDQLKAAEEALAKSSSAHKSEISAFLSKISHLERQLLNSVPSDLYDTLKALQSSNSSLQVSHNAFVSICNLLNLSPDPDKAIESIKGFQSAILNYENLCLDLSRELKVDPNEAFETFKRVSEEKKNQQKLYEKLADLLKQFSPQGRFKEMPTCHQIWKWVTRVLEEFMLLKKEALKGL